MPTKDEIYQLFEPIDYKLSKDESNGLITFSVYGPHSIYNDGAIENIPLAQQYYPEWNLRFYVDETSPILSRLWKEDVDIFVMKKPRGVLGTFWRLLDIGNCRYEYVLIRDTDQRLSDKESKAVDDWLLSGRLAHRMYEGSNQTGVPLMACAIGFRTCVIDNMLEDIADWLISKCGHEITHWATTTGGADHFPRLLYGAEQFYLTERIWPLIKDSCLTHGELGVPFPPWSGYLPWGGTEMFKRITPHTHNRIIFGERPQYAYDTENH